MSHVIWDGMPGGKMFTILIVSADMNMAVHDYCNKAYLAAQ